MIPHQIYCDYLEDKGVDTRLLRTQESEGVYIVNSIEVEGRGFTSSSSAWGWSRIWCV